MIKTTLDWPTFAAAYHPLFASTCLQNFRISGCGVPEGYWRQIVKTLPHGRIPGQFRTLELHEGGQHSLLAYPANPFELSSVVGSCPGTENLTFSWSWQLNFGHALSSSELTRSALVQLSALTSLKVLFTTPLHEDTLSAMGIPQLTNLILGPGSKWALADAGAPAPDKPSATDSNGFQ